MVSPAAIIRRKAFGTQALERQDRRPRHARRFLIAHTARLLCDRRGGMDNRLSADQGDAGTAPGARTRSFRGRGGVSAEVTSAASIGVLASGVAG